MIPWGSAQPQREVLLGLLTMTGISKHLALCAEYAASHGARLVQAPLNHTGCLYNSLVPWECMRTVFILRKKHLAIGRSSYTLDGACFPTLCPPQQCLPRLAARTVYIPSDFPPECCSFFSPTHHHTTPLHTQALVKLKLKAYSATQTHTTNTTTQVNFKSSIKSTIKPSTKTTKQANFKSTSSQPQVNNHQVHTTKSTSSQDNSR